MKRLLFLLIIILAPLLVKSQGMLDPTKWTISYSKKELKVNETVDIILTVTIKDGWHFYSLGEEPPQANFLFEGTGFEAVGKVKESDGVQKKFDENLEMNVSYFNKTAVFRQTVKVLKKNPVITIEVEGQACPSGPGQCVRVNKSFTVTDLKISDAAPTNNEDQKTPEKLKTTAPQKNVADNENLKRLEAEKSKLITKDANGKDESIEYLRSFANKYAVKK